MSGKFFTRAAFVLRLILAESSAAPSLCAQLLEHFAQRAPECEETFDIGINRQRFDSGLRFANQIASGVNCLVQCAIRRTIFSRFRSSPRIFSGVEDQRLEQPFALELRCRAQENQYRQGKLSFPQIRFRAFLPVGRFASGDVQAIVINFDKRSRFAFRNFSKSRSRQSWRCQ